MSSENEIRIMHFVHSLNEGGIERLLLELCEKTDRNKFSIQICCLVEKGIIATLFEKSGVKVHFVKAKRDLKPGNFIPNLFALIRIIKLLKKERISITHGHEFFSTVFSRIASVLAGVKKRFITLHNCYYWWTPGVHKMQRKLSGITTKIVCNSKATMEYSIVYDKIEKEKYKLIYNGIDCSKFSPKISSREKFLEEFGIDHRKNELTVCMFAGSISERKGLEYLVRAAALLKEDNPHLIYILAGGKHAHEEAEFDRIKNLIEHFGLKKKVFITGSRNDISEILNHCDIYLMPSVAEGFGLALTEAMAEEKVCIASYIAPFKEIITDNVDGLFFKSKDEGSLAAKIKEVMNMDKALLNNIGRNARRTIEERFSSARMVKEYEELYSGF